MFDCIKFIIVGIDEIDKMSYAKCIVELDDDLSIAPTFTSQKEYKNQLNEDYIYYLDPLKINLSYKNNALLYIEHKDTIFSGITLDDLYNNDIIITSMSNYNSIPDIVFTKYNIVTIWLDTKNYTKSQSYFNEVKYIQEKIEKFPYMYFLDEDPQYVAETILAFLNADENEKNSILNENC